MRSLLLSLLVFGCATCVALTKGGSTLKKAVVRGRLVAHGAREAREAKDASNSAFNDFLPKLIQKVPQIGNNVIHSAAGDRVAGQTIQALLKKKYQADFTVIWEAMFGDREPASPSTLSPAPSALQKCDKQCHDDACIAERTACQELHRGLVAASQQEVGCKMYEVKFALKIVNPAELGDDHGPGWYFFEQFEEGDEAANKHKDNWDAYSTKTDKKFRFMKGAMSADGKKKILFPWSQVEGPMLYNCGGPTEIDGVNGKVKACWFTAEALEAGTSSA